MTYNADIHHKFSIRKEGHDYALSGFYFITICTRNRECIFGDIVDNKMQLNDVGKIIHHEWLQTPHIRNNVILDEFVVMPNHVHLLFEINEVTGRDEEGLVQQRIDVNQSLRQGQSMRKFGPQSQNVFAIIRGFKGACSLQVNKLLHQDPGTIWQSRFYDTIMTSDEQLTNIRLYIKQNPENWPKDDFNGKF